MWFVEPEQKDDTWAKPGEGRVSWLLRSTLPRASAMRGFLNRNVGALPEPCREGVLEKLAREQHFKDGFFELVVGRALQELGTVTLDCEKENPTGRKRPDFLATFPDGAVAVEAISPIMDRELEAIEDRRPEGTHTPAYRGEHAGRMGGTHKATFAGWSR